MRGDISCCYRCVEGVFRNKTYKIPTFLHVIEMEEVESPSSKTVSSSRLSGQDLGGDAEMREPLTKKKSSSSKRKSRGAEKENGEVNSSTNGDVHGNESQAVSHNGENKSEKVMVSTSSIEQNGDEGANGEESESGSNGKSSPEAEVKTVNGSAANDGTESEKVEEREFEAGEEEGKEREREREKLGGEKSNGDQDGGDHEPEATPPEDAEKEEEGTADGESDREKENGFEEPSTVEKSEKKGFFRNWSFSLIPENKEPETNGLTEDSTACELYYSSIQGRMPLKRTLPSGENSKESSGYRKGFKTPTNPTRSLDDSFGVKSEPSRIHRAESKEKPSLRKYPAKRCLNADDSDEKEDGLVPNISFSKRRKVEDEKAVCGFLRSFLWSPFRKRSLSHDIAPEESEDKTTVAKPWFRSPFWFWKRFNKEERN